jgi:hypothetical protein
MAESTTAPSRLARLAAWVGAWQPLTGGGVAAFAQATLVRVVVFQFAFAFAGAFALVLALRLAWVPTVEDALRQLPEHTANVKAGRLNWPGINLVVLGERPQLSLMVNPVEGTKTGQVSDIQAELLPDRLRVRGLLGFVDLAYPPELELPLTLTGGRAAWDAWRTSGAAVAGGLTAAGLIAGWWILATIYALPVWGIAVLGSRSPGAAGAWKLAAVSQLPATALLFGFLLLYAVRAIPPTGLGVGAVISLLSAWVWIAWAIAKLPASSATASPTEGTAAETSTDRKAKSQRKKNPFGA